MLHAAGLYVQIALNLLWQKKKLTSKSPSIYTRYLQKFGEHRKLALFTKRHLRPEVLFLFLFKAPTATCNLFFWRYNYEHYGSYQVHYTTIMNVMHAHTVTNIQVKYDLFISCKFFHLLLLLSSWMYFSVANKLLALTTATMKLDDWSFNCLFILDLRLSSR